MSDHWIIYEHPETKQRRIRFHTHHALATIGPRRAGHVTPKTGAMLTRAEQVIVIDGRRRAVGCAQGDVIPVDLGGVRGQPFVLDYELIEGTNDADGVPLLDLQID